MWMRFYLLRKNVSFQVNKIIMKYFLITFIILFFSNLYAKEFNVDNSRRVTHTALIDCDLLAKVYINLIDQKEPMLNFQESDNQNINQNEKDFAYFKKVIRPTEVELEKHKEYLTKSLKKNFF